MPKRSDRRYTEWLLIERQKIYALGQFATRGSVDLDLNLVEDVKLLLAEWKTRTAELLERFDLDKNGQLDLKEWELARAQAKREVAANHRELRAARERRSQRQQQNQPATFDRESDDAGDHILILVACVSLAEFGLQDEAVGGSNALRAI